ncbi:hypothetical protein AGMMS50233_06270 [Endomicrobiia bacterium]|nr:hypothetical protein AGMMS50233_06270 [Endomicrobiia bacterium]
MLDEDHDSKLVGLYDGLSSLYGLLDEDHDSKLVGLYDGLSSLYGLLDEDHDSKLVGLYDDLTDLTGPSVGVGSHLEHDLHELNIIKPDNIITFNNIVFAFINSPFKFNFLNKHQPKFTAKIRTKNRHFSYIKPDENRPKNN